MIYEVETRGILNEFAVFRFWGRLFRKKFSDKHCKVQKLTVQKKILVLEGVGRIWAGLRLLKMTASQRIRYQVDFGCDFQQFTGFRLLGTSIPLEILL